MLQCSAVIYLDGALAIKRRAVVKVREVLRADVDMQRKSVRALGALHANHQHVALPQRHLRKQSPADRRAGCERPKQIWH